MQSQVVVVSGAASGIGYATAKLFCEQGHTVIGLDLDLKGLQRAQQALGVGSFSFHSLSISDEASVSEAFQKIGADHATIHTVISCAGIAQTGEIHSASLDHWNKQIAVNLTGTYILSKYAMQHFVKASGGAFVAVSSDAGVRGASGYGAYCASKHGVIGLVRCLALDYGPLGIRSNVVCPGFVRTQMMDKLFAEATDPKAEMAGYAREVPLGRFAMPEEIAKVIKHLCSEEASYSNGAVYMVDGGVTAGHLG